jgi:hypothetical protein
LQPPSCEISSTEETIRSERLAVPRCHGGVPNRYAPEARFSEITIAIRNSSMGQF